MTWYVNSKTGRDSNDGRSAETAFKNLSHALGAATAGDAILLVPGVFDEDLPKLVGAARVAHVTMAVVGGH
ncbi:MAG TPA: hypothetical protein VMW68_05175 [Methyloceanibacter sp.]|nr:hypothetical protein [Methyloceanibacter sp.]